jgi:hypothetical protein
MTALGVLTPVRPCAYTDGRLADGCVVVVAGVRSRSSLVPGGLKAGRDCCAVGDCVL